MLNKAQNVKRITQLFIVVLFSVLCSVPGIQAEGIYNYDAKGKRNPFIPLITSDGKLTKVDEQQQKSDDLLLEGIIYDPHGISYAVVNGSVVKIGDLINDYNVLKIQNNKVIFIKDSQLREVEIKKEDE